MLVGRAARGSGDPSGAEGRGSEDLGSAIIKRTRHGLTGCRTVGNRLNEEGRSRDLALTWRTHGELAVAPYPAANLGDFDSVETI
jgi:hypothetical protein